MAHLYGVSDKALKFKRGTRAAPNSAKKQTPCEYTSGSTVSRHTLENLTDTGLDIQWLWCPIKITQIDPEGEIVGKSASRILYCKRNIRRWKILKNIAHAHTRAQLMVIRHAIPQSGDDRRSGWEWSKRGGEAGIYWSLPHQRMEMEWVKGVGGDAHLTPPGYSKG